MQAHRIIEETDGAGKSGKGEAVFYDKKGKQQQEFAPIPRERSFSRREFDDRHPGKVIG